VRFRIHFRYVEQEIFVVDILIVDDNADYLELLKDALYGKGYSVYTAGDGIEGCEILTSKDIDIIISDIKMPRLDGIKLHQFARQLDQYKRTKFVFITAYREMYGNMLELNPEIDFFLEKSAPVQDIIKTVNKLAFGDFAGVWV